MRAVLVALLINGLVPALGEVAEAVVHYAQTGHLAHGHPGEQDLGDLGREHGCGGSQHQCECCPSQAMTLSPSATSASAVALATELSADPAAPPRARSLEPPLRPPIA